MYIYQTFFQNLDSLKTKLHCEDKNSQIHIFNWDLSFVKTVLVKWIREKVFVKMNSWFCLSFKWLFVKISIRGIVFRKMTDNLQCSFCTFGKYRIRYLKNRTRVRNSIQIRLCLWVYIRNQCLKNRFPNIEFPEIIQASKGFSQPKLKVNFEPNS